MRRYRAILVSDEDAAQVDRLTYNLDRRGGAGEEGRGASRRGEDPGAGPGDPARDPDRSPAPFVHAATRKIRKELWEAYGWFVAAYREAAEKLRNGDRNAAFRPGSFPPHLPFVPA